MAERLSLDALVAQLRQVHGAALECVVLYGSGAVDADVAGRSDLNVLVIVSSLSMDTMRQLGPTVRAWGEAGHPPPLTLTHDEWRRSADIFPMEYTDILERHRVLAGTAPFEGLVVDPEHLRLELEFEAMGTVLRLARQRPSRDHEHVIRAVDALHRAGVPHVAGEPVFAADAFVRVARLVRGEAMSATDTSAVLAAYVQSMDAVVDFLDRYSPPGAPGTTLS